MTGSVGQFYFKLHSMNEVDGEVAKMAQQAMNRREYIEKSMRKQHDLASI